MQRATAVLTILVLSIASSNHAFGADDTRVQHRTWMRKLVTPGGTFPEELDAIMEHGTSMGLAPNGTSTQHRSWIRKQDVSGRISGVSL